MRKILLECLHDPREPEGVFQNIATTAGRDYHQNRAIEIIKNGADALEYDNDHKTYHDRMRLAIGLLALAIAETPTAVEQ